MGAVGDAIGSITEPILGGKQKVMQGKNFDPITEEEKVRIADIERKLTDLYNQNPDDMSNLFRQHLTQFLTSKQGPEASQEQLANATKFVDQIYTAPAQEAMRQQVADYTSAAQANAAAMGRAPNLDVATQQAIAGEAIRQQLGLNLNRGQMVGQEALRQNQEGYNRSLNQLNAALQGSGFLNNLNQRAFENRLNLLNARSGLAKFYQSERGMSNAGISTSPGLLGGIAGAAGQVAGTIGAIRDIKQGI